MNKTAVCLLSGGLDSSTALFCAMSEGYTPLALTLSYGQLHTRELSSARILAARLGIEHEVISIDMPWKGSALLDRQIEVPDYRTSADQGNRIPVTYVPARNTIFLSFAASFAETRGAEAIYIGANAIDYSGYPDCRLDYFKAMERVLALGTRAGVEGKTLQIKTPLIGLKKSEIIKLAVNMRVPLEITWSCYKGGDTPCGVCDSCAFRSKGFEEAGLEDPLVQLQSKEINEA